MAAPGAFCIFLSLAECSVRLGEVGVISAISSPGSIKYGIDIKLARHIKEAWLSGLKQHTANVLAGKPARRFESFRLRLRFAEANLRRDKVRQ